jgi:thiol:disulfide interchange protein DsbC
VKQNWIAIPVAVACSVAWAQEDEKLSKADLAAKLSGVDANDISDSPLDGIYEVSVGANVAYVTADGRYLLQGELYDLLTNQNLTDQTRSLTRVDLLASVEPADMIVFSPENGEVKHTITIFTDIDCGYCRQFHREIEQVNALGIEVHYLFYPRSGPDTESWAKADKVWCAADRNAALTRAKLGGNVPDASCSDTPVAAHWDLGHQVGVRGTPAMYSETGEHLGGYLPPAALAKLLDESAQ